MRFLNIKIGYLITWGPVFSVFSLLNLSFIISYFWKIYSFSVLYNLIYLFDFNTIFDTLNGTKYECLLYDLKIKLDTQSLIRKQGKPYIRGVRWVWGFCLRYFVFILCFYVLDLVTFCFITFTLNFVEKCIYFLALFLFFYGRLR